MCLGLPRMRRTMANSEEPNVAPTDFDLPLSNRHAGVTEEEHGRDTIASRDGNDDDVDQVLASLTEADAATPAVTGALSLDDFATYVPSAAIELARSLTNTDWLAARTLYTVDEYICRRLGDHTLQDRR